MSAHKAPPIGARPQSDPRPLRPPEPPPIERFVGLSVAITGFTSAELYGTGMIDVYYNVMLDTLGEPLVGRLLSQWAEIADVDPYLRDDYLRTTVFANDTLGPMARNLIMLWYLGQWSQMPMAWRTTHGANTQDFDRIVSPEAYTQSLVWAAFKGHPQGAKPPGFASWSLEPAEENES